MDLLNLTQCPHPFLNPADYPADGGYIPGRFCGTVTPSLSCCLPCPIAHWLYSDAFTHKLRIAYWFNVPALVAQAFLLLTFAMLPSEKGGGSGGFLGVGLCVSLVGLELAFIIPLGTKPHMCFNAITPNDMHSDLSCAWTGALLEAGALAATAWILLRSLHTNLRVCFDIHPTPLTTALAHVFGWGAPALFLTLSLSVTGVSYRLGTTCIPNPEGAIATWFGWLIGFACAGALIQFATSGFVLFVYTRNLVRGGSQGTAGTGTGTSVSTGLKGDGETVASLGKKLAWRRVRKVMLLQWRSIVLSVLVIVQAAYFGTIYVALTRAQSANESTARTAEAEEWSTCIVLSGGDKEQCLQYSRAMGVSEDVVVASMFMASLIGLFTFTLMARKSMFIGWYELLCDPRSIRFNKRYSGQKFMAARKRISGHSRKSGDEKKMFRNFERLEILERKAMFVLPDPEGVGMEVPEAGDVSTRHQTTNLFEDEEGVDSDGEEVRRVQKGSKRVAKGDESDMV